MQASELRIGNIVKLNNPKHWTGLAGRYFKVTGIDLNMSEYAIRLELINPVDISEQISRELNQFIEFIEPVILSPEILERCGFNHQHIGGKSMMVSDSPYGRKSFTVTENTDIAAGYWVFIITDFPPDENIGSDCVFASRKLQYLHQLQNLFFALQRTELTINL